MRSGWTPAQLLTVITSEGRHQTVGLGRDSEGDFCLSPDTLPIKNVLKIIKKKEKNKQKTQKQAKNNRDLHA